MQKKNCNAGFVHTCHHLRIVGNNKWRAMGFVYAIGLHRTFD